ncbi:MAG: DUF421 domain-containing protein [Oscillospiraceae bacterium]
MFSIIFRTVIMFALIIFTMRIMGKKNLGEFQPSDLVSTILISNLTSLVIEAPELPLINSIVPILLIMCIEVFISIYVKKNENFAHIVQGKSMVLIQNGLINQQTMEDLRFSVDDVLEAMRGKDVFYLEEVCLAIVETTGVINIYKDPNVNTNIKKNPIPALPVIVDSKIIYENLKLTGFPLEKLDNILKKSSIEIDNVLLMTLDGGMQYNITQREVL